jgi:hypothetical protein
MLHLKKFEGLFSGGKFHKVFPKRTPEELEAENKLREEEKKKKEEEDFRLQKIAEEKAKEAKLEKLKELVDPLIDSLKKYRDLSNLKEYHVSVSSFGSSAGKIGSITLESNLDLKKYLELSKYKPNIESLNFKLRFNIDIDSSSSNFIKVVSYSIKFESNLTWDYNSKHEGMYYQKNGGYRCTLSKSYPKWKFETETPSFETYSYSSSVSQNNISNLSAFSVVSKMQDSIQDHLKLTFFYCGIDENNQKYLDKLETVKDNLDYIYYCFYDISDIANDPTEPYISEPKKDSNGRVTDNKIIIGYVFKLNIGVSPVVDGINLKLTKNLISIFDSLAEARPRILDILPDAEIDIDILSKKSPMNQYTANPNISILKVFITIPI